MYDVERVERLRTKVAEEKRLAVELSERFTQAPFKPRAKRLAATADEFGRMFLGQNLEPWQPQEIETMTLNGVELAIKHLVSDPREYLQTILEKWGPDVAQPSAGRG